MRRLLAKRAHVIGVQQVAFGSFEADVLGFELGLIGQQMLDGKARHDVVGGGHQAGDDQHGGDEAGSHGVAAGPASDRIHHAHNAAVVDSLYEEIDILIGDRAQAGRIRPRPNGGGSLGQLSYAYESIHESSQ